MDNGAIKQKIVCGLQQIAATAESEKWTSDRTWTIAIKQLLDELGKQYGFRTCANGCDSSMVANGCGDFVWLELDQENQIIDVPLVVESEWGNTLAVLDDFQKIVIVNARLKLMIFQPRDLNSTLTTLKNTVLAFRYTRPGDHYLFACWYDRAWTFETFVVD